jgi:hypothetical protein
VARRKSSHETERTDRSRRLDEKHLLAAMCFWEKKPADMSALRRLEDRTWLIAGGRKIRYALFSRAGFAKQLRELRQADLLLVSLEDLLKIG